MVAKLPFVPLKPLYGLTHGLIDDADTSSCCAAFLYILTMLTFRNSIRKGLGINRPRTREPITIGIPSKFFGPADENSSWYQSPRIVFLVMAGIYGYSFYKLMRRH